jgi:acyl transferase domain-containing protein
MTLSGMTERLAQQLDRFLSASTGGSLTQRDTETLRGWTPSRARGVRFDDSLRVANDARARLLVDAAPAGHGLCSVRFIPPVGGGAPATPLLRRSGQFDSEGLLEALGRVWASGVDIDFDALDTASRARGVPPPTGSFERRDD